MRRSLRNPARTLALLAALGGALAGPALAQESSPVGDWSGTLSAGGTEIPLTLHVTQADDGSFAVALDSPSQGAFGIPGSDAIFEDGKFTASFDIPGGAGYEGMMSADGSTLEGNWSQQGNSLPLSLMRGDTPTGE